MAPSITTVLGKFPIVNRDLVDSLRLVRDHVDENCPFVQRAAAIRFTAETFEDSDHVFDFECGWAWAPNGKYLEELVVTVTMGDGTEFVESDNVDEMDIDVRLFEMLDDINYDMEAQS